jgi:hypothetical protein
MRLVGLISQKNLRKKGKLENKLGAYKVTISHLKTKITYLRIIFKNNYIQNA